MLPLRLLLKGTFMVYGAERSGRGRGGAGRGRQTVLGLVRLVPRPFAGPAARRLARRASGVERRAQGTR
ncbi:hypothetical protein EVAR_4073_1 [Eumeta japonica]|uniref:Uncharacterized protein n=1 Tax=Eumeta variegata TaxID=151549 RepID=A0A4C1T3W9_EUMVA|nr:hypothetical protein EVAR_4073_1 [Eumeta japonica]